VRRTQVSLLVGLSVAVIGGGAMMWLLGRGEEPVVTGQPVITDVARGDASGLTTGAPSPWTRRFARACTEWSGSTVLATDRHVFACDHAVFDRETGELVTVMPRTRFDGVAVNGGSLWRSFEEEGLLFLDHELQIVWRLPMPERPEGYAASPDGDRLLAFGDSLAVIDLERRREARSPGAEACDDAFAAGFTADGNIQCLVRCGEDSCLRTLGRAGSTPLPALSDARWARTGRAIFAVDSRRAYWLELDGTVRERIELAGIREPQILDIAPSGERVLLGSSARTVILARDGDETHEEHVVEVGSTSGAFAGEDQVVVGTQTQDTLWLHRGEPQTLPTLPLPQLPDSFVQYRPTRAGVAMDFVNEEGSITRGLTDVAAFDDRDSSAPVYVARSDASELARFTRDDTAWGRAAADRYLVLGAERWAVVARDAEGRRVLRGHAYIGGCERTHTDLLLREDRGVLERLIIYTGVEQRHRELLVDRAVGPTPAGALRILNPDDSGYAGDPSIGPVR